MTPEEFALEFQKLYDNVAPFEKGSDDEVSRRFENRAEAHWEACKNYPIDVYRRGCRYYLAHETSREFPRPAHILDAIRDSYEPPAHKAPPPEERARRQAVKDELDGMTLDAILSMGDRVTTIESVESEKSDKE